MLPGNTKYPGAACGWLVFPVAVLLGPGGQRGGSMARRSSPTAFQEPLRGLSRVGFGIFSGPFGGCGCWVGGLRV